MWLVLLYPEPKRETHSELRNTTGRLGFDKTRLSQARSRLLARAGARGANLFLNLILDRHAQRVVVLEPAISSQLIRKHLEVVEIADLFAGVNVDQNFHLGLVISWRPVLTGQSAPVLLRHANDLLFRASEPGGYRSTRTGQRDAMSPAASTAVQPQRSYRGREPSCTSLSHRRAITALAGLQEQHYGDIRQPV